MAVYLLRHAHAGSRHDWKGPDDERPLSKKGWREAEGFAEAVAGADDDVDRVTCILSSPSRRCVQTVEPLAKALGLEIEEVPALCEGADIDAAVELVRQAERSTWVLCTHGDVGPPLLDALCAADGLDLPAGSRFQKGAAWLLEADENGRFRRARYLPPRH